MVRLSEQMAAARTRRGGGSWGGEDKDETVVDRIEKEYGPEKSNNPNDVMYTGGTPTQAYAYQHPVEKAAGKALPSAIGMTMPTFLPPIFDKGGMFGPDEDKPEGNVGTRFADETSELIEATVYKGMEAADWVWSNTVARTASSVAITAADVLDGGEFKATPSDTWNRASSVSYGQAYTQAGVATLTSLQSIFGFDTKGLLEDWNVDLWSDADIARAQQQVYAYSTVTGVVDTALNLLPIPASKGVGAASRAAGLSKTMSRGQFKRVYDDGMRGIEARQPEGAPIVVEGSENVRQSGRRINDEWNMPGERVDDPSRKPLRGNELGDEAIRVAATDDVIRIMESPLVQGQVAADPLKLANILSRVKDPQQVLRIHLATLGDVKAASKLFRDMPEEAWQLSGVSEVIKKADPETYIPMNEQMDVAYYQSMDDFDRALYDALITDGGFAAQGRRTIATGRTFDNTVLDSTVGAATRSAAGVMGRAQVRAAERRTAIKSGDFDKYMSKRAVVTDDGRVEYKTTMLGRAGAATQLIDFTPYWQAAQNRTRRGLSQRPLNVFSYARTRPQDLKNEFFAMVAESPALRVGNQVIDEFGNKMDAAEWTQNAARRLVDASARSTAELKTTFQAIQEEMVYQMGRDKGLTNEQIARFYEGFNNKVQEFMNDVRTNGKYVDSETSNVVQFDPRTIRELANSEMTVPLERLSLYLDEHIPSDIGGVYRRSMQADAYARQLGTEMFDMGAMFFRTGMLLKPGYIMRNALFEPGITAMIAHIGSAPGMLGRDLLKGTARWFYNRLGVDIPAIFKSLPNAKAKGAMKTAITRYRTALQVRDDLIAELDSHVLGSVPPSMMGNAGIIRNQVHQVNAMLTNVLKTIADISPETARVLINAVDFEYTSKIARGAREILEGSDAPLVAVRQEIKEWSDILDEMGELATDTDLAYLERLQGQQDIFEAIVDARRSNMSFGARKAGDDTKARGEASDGNEKLLGHVANLLDQYGRREIERTFIPDMVEDNMSYLTDMARKIQEATEVIREQKGLVRDAQATYARAAAKSESTRKRKKRTGEEKKTIRTTAGDVDYEGAFYGPVGPAYREDASGHVTAINNFAPMGGESTLHRMIMNRYRRLEFAMISPTDPVYFTELHYYATRTWAREPVVAPVFEAATREIRVQKIIDNVMGDSKYRAEMGLKNKRDVERFAVDTVDIVDEMFPSQKARDLIGSGEDFGPGQLAEAILDDPNAVLRPIDGQQLRPHNDTKMASLQNAISGVLDKVWRAIAVTPEASLGRWPYYARQHEIQFTRKIEDLALQSDTISLGDANAARLYAHRETLAELEKVFYTIRRYNRGIFTSRFMQTFPGAWANGIYRYLYYLPTRYLGETTSALLIGKDIVDEMIYGDDGEKADFWDDDAVMLVNKAPVVGEFVAAANQKLLGKDPDEGIRLEKNALMRVFADIPPGRSYLTAFSVDALLSYGPAYLRNKGEYEKADTLQGSQQVLGDALEDLFGDRDAFGLLQIAEAGLYGDYGPTKEFAFGGLAGIALGSITPGYVRSFVNWVGGSGEDWSRIANYQIQKVFSRRELDEDTSDIDFEKEISQPTTDWFRARFFEQWLGMDLGAVRMPNYPGQVYRDGWRRINEDNPDLEWEKKLELLEEEFPDVTPEALLPFTKSTSKNTYGVAANIEAYGEVERFPEAARAIASGGDPYYVGLLAMNKDTSWGESSQVVYNVMKSDAPFEGGQPYRTVVPPDEYLVEMQVGKGWDEFTMVDEYLDVEESIARDAKDRDAVQAIKNLRRDWLHNPEDGMRVRHPQWYQRYIDPKAERHEKVSSLIQENIINDPKVWEQKSKDPAWVILAEFLEVRDYVKLERVNASDRETKYALDQLMIDTYGVILGESEYPMLKDLWDTVYEPQYDSEYVTLLDIEGEAE